MATDKQKAFVAAYLRNGLNATEAAKAAGYKGSYDSLRAIGSENLTKLNIRAEIDKALNERAMGRDEVLHRISEQARGDMGDFLKVGEYGVTLDLEQAKQLGKLGLIKKYRVDKDGNVSFELYSSQAALEMLARAHGIYSDAKTGSDGDFSEWLEALPKERDGI